MRSVADEEAANAAHEIRTPLSTIDGRFQDKYAVKTGEKVGKYGARAALIIRNSRKEPQELTGESYNFMQEGSIQ